MGDLTEINDYNIVRTLSKSENSYTYVVISKGMQNMSDEYFKVLKLKKIRGNYQLIQRFLLFCANFSFLRRDINLWSFHLQIFLVIL